MEKSDLKVGDEVLRVLAGSITMFMTVTAITDNRIICGAWEFDRATGVEVDEDLGWGPKYGKTGSILKRRGVNGLWEPL